MKKYCSLTLMFGALLMLTGISACSKSKSYSELLRTEEKAVNWFMAQHEIVSSVPEDSVFEVGKDAPYYRMDEEGYVYMQVLKTGDLKNKAKKDQQIYFRYTRWSLASYNDGKLPTGAGNNITLSPAWFRYNNYQIQSSYNWGTGVQTPLNYLPVDCVVNIVIKSQNGFTQETSDVRPYLYRLTYERRQ